jgi:hypothetical protein
MNAYRVAKAKFKRTLNPDHDPGPKPEFEANIRYTRLDTVHTMLDPTMRTAIRNQIADDTSAATVLRRIVSNPDILTSPKNTPQGIANKISEFLAVHAATIELLEHLGAEPVLTGNADTPE